MPNDLSVHLGDLGDRQCFRTPECINNVLLRMIRMRGIRKSLLSDSVNLFDVGRALAANLDIQCSTSCYSGLVPAHDKAHTDPVPTGRCSVLTSTSLQPDILLINNAPFRVDYRFYT